MIFIFYIKDLFRIYKHIICSIILTLFILSYNALYAQHHHIDDHHSIPIVKDVEAQPLLQHALSVGEALSFIGSDLPASAIKQLKALKHLPFDQETVIKVQEILDPYCLVAIDINPESRVKVEHGPAKKKLVQEGWSTFLVKIHNQANVTAKLVAESPNARPRLQTYWGERKLEEDSLSIGQIQNRFIDISINRNRPLIPNLTGLELEYAVIHIYTREKGKRMVELGFNVGQGTQDIGFRNATNILFDIQPAVKVKLDVKDENNTPGIGSFIITDDIERYSQSDLINPSHPWRFPWRDWEDSDLVTSVPDDTISGIQKLRGVYPLPAKRLAEVDPFPDFFFQPQIYRKDGEYVYLPPGEYNVIYGRGPEYHTKQQKLIVPENVDSIRASFHLKRWIHMAKLGWYSADHHIHTAGCEHYQIPWEGVGPEHIFRQIQGEDLNVGFALNWSPGWYHQKQYFTGNKIHPLSTQDNILRYDVEVSGFPSSHAGHLGLLNLKEDNYPGTAKIEEWPSFTLPILKWAKEQGALTGYTHSGWGLAPVGREHTNYLLEAYSQDLPNYEIPRMDGIGANEYVMTVAHGVVDFYGLGNTPIPNELNMWYHTLNSGFRPRISGESDFPCIVDDRVGITRTYVKLDEELNFTSFIEAFEKGRSYVSDGFSHLIDFSVNEVKLGKMNSELNVSSGTNLDINVKVAAFLNEIQDRKGAFISSRAPNEQPYWDIERARIDSTRKIPVELIVNGYIVDTIEVIADGDWNKVSFNHEIESSSWVAIRVYGSSHTNPIFVLVDGMPIRVKKSAKWLLEALEQCWEMKKNRIREEELVAAQEAYDYARNVYDNIINKSIHNE
jgi:hypothetical protein